MVGDREVFSARPIRSEFPLPLTHVPRLRIIALFEDLADADLKRIAESCSFRTYEREAQIMSEQDQTDDVFFILFKNEKIFSIIRIF